MSSDEDYGTLYHLQAQVNGSTTSYEAYGLLAVAVVLESAGTLSLRFASDSPPLLVLSYGLYACSLALFPRVLAQMRVGVAYALWCAGGCLITSLCDLLILRDGITGRQAASVLLVVTGAAGLVL